METPQLLPEGAGGVRGLSTDFLSEVFGPLSYHPSSGWKKYPECNGVREDTVDVSATPGTKAFICIMQENIICLLVPKPHFSDSLSGGLALFTPFGKFLSKQLVEDALQKSVGYLILVRF